MKIFILESDNDNSYKVAIHFATPTGNNSVGNSWKECALEAGMIGSTILEVGAAPGNISHAEYDSIIVGDTIEIIRSINPGLDPSNAAVFDACNICVGEYHADMARILKYYGHTIGA
jgi:hypothetical protein